MAVETTHQELSSSQKEFESLLNDDFKDRKLKEGEIMFLTLYFLIHMAEYLLYYTVNTNC